MLKILSLGAGIQSSTVFLMSCRGILPKLDHAIFADTGWEPDEVYATMEFLEDQGKLHGIPVHRVRAGNIREDALVSQVRGHVGDGGRWASMPYFCSDGKSRIKRQCTAEYKIQPIQKKIKEVLGIAPGRRWPIEPTVEQWFSISADEASRMRTSDAKWKINIYPLCNIPGDYLPYPFKRQDCINWLRENYPDRQFARSACLGCPFHSNAEWRIIRRNPKYWMDVVAFDKHIRKLDGMKLDVYLHRSCKPLDEVVLSDDRQMEMWDEECLGMCGV